jgi:catechol 2,3-dioxygenase-like lactoylglutathione lyase family enzyme
MQKPMTWKSIDGTITRRALLLSVPAWSAARTLLAQGPAPVRVRGLHHVTLVVADLKRSVAFYQGLFGMPVQARHGASKVLLRLGAGPQFMALRQADGGETARIDHLGMSVEDFDVDRLVRALEAHGISRAESTASGLSGGPLKLRVSSRGGTPEIHVGDPDGIVVQLQAPDYCGGSGPLGATCGAIEPAPSRGLFALTDLSHFTIQATDAQRANTFYQQTFGLHIQAMQAATPALGVGRGVHFLMFTGGAGGGRGRGADAAAPAPPPRPARIDHVCVNLPNFNLEQLQKGLESYGIKPRAAGSSGPLQWWVSMRMPNRGGAPEGTPELYFSDPDGLSIQIQDVKYCGGGGYLGDVCQD